MKQTGRTMKRTVAAITIAGMLAVGVAAFAAEARTPAEIVADLTGKTVEAVTAERADGETYGTIAKDAGKLDAFKAAMLESRKALLEERVAAGTLTREKADEILAAIEKNMETCDGTGSARIGRTSGAGFGQGGGMRNGAGRMGGMGNGAGRMGGMGRGAGAGLCGGSCTVTPAQ